MAEALHLDSVDLAALACWIDSPDYGAAYVDPTTGEVIPAFEGEVLGTDGEPVDLDEVDWRPVGGSSGAAYRDMEIFADAVGDAALSRRLWSTLGGRGSFRRFRDCVYRQPEHISRAWGRFSDLRSMYRALEWLQDERLVVESEAEIRAQQLKEEIERTLELVSTARPR